MISCTKESIWHSIPPPMVKKTKRGWDFLWKSLESSTFAEKSHAGPHEYDASAIENLFHLLYLLPHLLKVQQNRGTGVELYRQSDTLPGTRHQQKCLPDVGDSHLRVYEQPFMD